jgi:hypothetical protein
MCQCRASTARGLRLAFGEKCRHVQDAHNSPPFTYNFELPRVWSVVVGDSPTPGVPTCQDVVFVLFQNACAVPDASRRCGGQASSRPQYSQFLILPAHIKSSIAVSTACGLLDPIHR